MSYTEIIHGSIPALITPFKNGDIDYSALKKLINWHVEEGSHGIVICGTTGESPTIHESEHIELIKQAVSFAPEGYPIIAGTGSNATDKAVILTKQAESAGATAALVVVPYYNKPSQNGLYQHFKAIHDATNIPIILYNVPGRTIVDMDNETVRKLAELPRIIGIKDASGEIERLIDMKQHITKDFVYLSGDDMSACDYLIAGGHGCISVSANVIPKLCSDVYNLIKTGDAEKAEELTDNIMPAHKAMFLEPSPAVPKYILAKKNMIEDSLRLPLLPLSIEGQNVIDTLDL